MNKFGLILSCLLVCLAQGAFGQSEPAPFSGSTPATTRFTPETSTEENTGALTPFRPTPPLSPSSSGSPAREPAMPITQPSNLDVDINALFAGVEGTFVLYDDQEGILLNYNPERAAQRFSPFSTFEIPAAVILLDSGILRSPDQVVPWDKNQYPAHPGLPKKLKNEWESDHTLRSAYQSYAGWFFQSLLEMTAPEEMTDYLKRFHYGNQRHQTPGFWLGKDLMISANEQVAFLYGLANDTFGLKPSTKTTVLPLLATEKNNAYTLALKTGSGVFAGGKSFGWAVGYIERANNRYYFAMNLDADDYVTLTEKRQAIVQGVLSRLGLVVPLSDE